VVWRQILAEVVGATLYGVDATEGAALGAALLAGVGARLWDTADEACAEVVRKTDQTTPASADKESTMSCMSSIGPCIRR